MNKNKIEGFHKDAPIDMTNQYMIFGHKICVIFLFYNEYHIYSTFQYRPSARKV
jgi:hypothetical protein